MFERELKEAKKKTKAELAKKIDSRYFGYYDENCAELLEHEARREKEFYDSHC